MRLGGNRRPAPVDKETRSFAKRIEELLADLKAIAVDLIAKVGIEGKSPDQHQHTSDPNETRSDTRINPAAPKPNPSNSKKEPAADKKPERFPRLAEWKPVLEVAGVGIVLVYTFITAMLLCENRKTNKIASDALDQGRIGSERQLRPYVLASKIDIVGNIKSGQRFVGTVEIVNYGQTPAVRVEGCADIALLPNTQPMSDDLRCPKPDNPGTGLTPTGERSIVNIGPSNSAMPFKLNTPGTSISPIEQVLPLFVNGAMRLYVYGDITYFDMINPHTRHTTQFCGRWNFSTLIFEVCEKHNGST